MVRPMASACLWSSVGYYGQAPPRLKLNLTSFQQSPDVHRDEVPSFKSLPASPVAAERHLLTAVQNLSNHLLANAASRGLVKTKNRQPELFRTPSIQYRVLHTLQNLHFRLPVRRYILDLFEIKFDAASLDEIARAGIAILDIDEFAPIPLDRVASSGSIRGKHLSRHPGWPSGQSDLMRDASSMTDRESATDEQDGVIPKVFLEPVVRINGFIRNTM
jgi:rapamycin-insensitive companion of mTOR